MVHNVNRIYLVFLYDMMILRPSFEHIGLSIQKSCSFSKPLAHKCALTSGFQSVVLDFTNQCSDMEFYPLS